MFPYVAWTEGAQRAARYRHEADVHRAVTGSGAASALRRAFATLLRRAADALANGERRPNALPAHLETIESAIRRSPVASA